MRHDNLISPGELAQLIGNGADKLSILDASWYLPVHGRNGQEEFEAARIPGAQYFDIELISDPDSPLPHMMPSAELFSTRVGELGVSEKNLIVVYDGMGIFSCARVWWMFKIMGAENVRILEGGFDRWKNSGLAVEEGEPKKPGSAEFIANFDASKMKSIEDLIRNLQTGECGVLDARSRDRYDGHAPEPRKGLKSGHIPGSLSLPFGELLEDGTLKSEDELRKILYRHGVNEGLPIITTCGSGVTAAVISLALDTIGHTNHSLYDGSWSEWGQAEGVPINTS